MGLQYSFWCLSGILAPLKGLPSCLDVSKSRSWGSRNLSLNICHVSTLRTAYLHFAQCLAQNKYLLNWSMTFSGSLAPTPAICLKSVWGLHLPTHPPCCSLLAQPQLQCGEFGKSGICAKPELSPHWVGFVANLTALNWLSLRNKTTDSKTKHFVQFDRDPSLWVLCPFYSLLHHSHISLGDPFVLSWAAHPTPQICKVILLRSKMTPGI